MTTALLDVNVLLALAWTNHDHHAAAVSHAAGLESWATTPLTESGFVRLSMNASVVQYPASFASALQLLRELVSQVEHVFWPDDNRLVEPRVTCTVDGHRQVTDAHLVALAARHDGQLVTFDRRVPALLRRADRGLVRVLTT